MICLEDAVKLLAAVGRQWAEDARHDAHELSLLADWLCMAPDDLRRKLETESQCRYCGGPLPASSKRKARLYCSPSCCGKANNLRRAKPPI